jgi:hypothetical protein
MHRFNHCKGLLLRFRVFLRPCFACPTAGTATPDCLPGLTSLRSFALLFIQCFTSLYLINNAFGVRLFPQPFFAGLARAGSLGETGRSVNTATNVVLKALQQRSASCSCVFAAVLFVPGTARFGIRPELPHLLNMLTKHTRSHYAFSSTQQVHPQQHSRIPHGQLSVKYAIYYLSGGSIVLSTNIQNWHDYNAFQFLIQQHNALQCEQIGMPHHLILRGWVGPPWVARACAEVSTGSVKAKHGPREAKKFLARTAPDPPGTPYGAQYVR